MDNKNNNERISLLAKKWQDGTITPSEKKEFDEWYNSVDDSFLELERDGDLQSLKDRISHSIDSELNLSTKNRSLFNTYFFRIAAAIVVLAGAGWFYANRTQDPRLSAAAKYDIPPGGQKAVLILSDGSTVVLDDNSGDQLLKLEGAEINRKDGQLLYAAGHGGSDKPSTLYHTIQIPNGGTYQLRLPDGTRVWLNAASSLRYPVDFKKDIREVELSGEGYFEVAKDHERPFIVKNEKLSVEVLGTHFNINSYGDEQEIKTTLLEGKVRILQASKKVVLAPMQQAVFNTSSQDFKVKDVDSKESIAWKEGDFYFDNELITSVMKKISRWYDVEVVYSGEIPDHRYIGKISRYENVSEVLKMLSLTKTIRFKVEERRITVMF